MEGPKEKRTNKKIWTDVVESEERLDLMRELIKLKLGFGDLEIFQLGQNDKFKSEKMKVRNGEIGTTKVVMEMMKLKLKDEEHYRREKDNVRKKRRRELEVKLGRNSRRFNNKMEELREDAKVAKLNLRKKNEKKLRNLKYKYREKVKEEVRIPRGLEEFENLTMFNSKKFEDLKVEEREVLILTLFLIGGGLL